MLTDLPSSAEKDLLVGEVIKSESHLNTLLHLALYAEDPLSWRASWVLDGSDERQPGLARKHISEIVQVLPKLESKGALRSLLRLLSRQEIQEKDQGLLIDLCFSYLVSELYPVAVKVHAMQIIYNHVLLYPELKGELVTVIEDQVKNNSVGFKSRGIKLIKQMEKL